MIGEEIPIYDGVKQGCVLSPLLFNMCIESVMNKTIEEQNGIVLNHITPTRLSDLKYANDICLTANSVSELQSMITSLEENAYEIGLQINSKMRKIMTTTCRNLLIAAFM